MRIPPRNKASLCNRLCRYSIESERQLETEVVVAKLREYWTFVVVGVGKGKRQGMLAISGALRLLVAGVPSNSYVKPLSLIYCITVIPEDIWNFHENGWGKLVSQIIINLLIHGS